MLFLYSRMEGGLKWVSTGLILTLYGFMLVFMLVSTGFILI